MKFVKTLRICLATMKSAMTMQTTWLKCLPKLTTPNVSLKQRRPHHAEKDLTAIRLEQKFINYFHGVAQNATPFLLNISLILCALV